jgi:predicted glycogen debranching enzyme
MVRPSETHAALPQRPLPVLLVDRDTCVDFSKSSRREWLETDGTGGFAMGTVSGANTRRYHGLLVASLKPPVDRYVLLAKVDETVVSDGSLVCLGSNQYPGTVFPKGYENLRSFRLDPFPIWTFEASGIVIEKKFFLVHGQKTAVLRYRASRACRILIHPFLAFRDYHALGRANGHFDPALRKKEIDHRLELEVRPYSDLPAMRLVSNGVSFQEDGCWHHQTEYLEELERGFDFREDLYRIGTIALDVGPGRDGYVVATIADDPVTNSMSIEEVEAHESSRRRSQWEDPFVARLEHAADQFLVRRSDGSLTAIAGYPWFTDWGRDTMIALPGLLLARKMYPETRAVLDGFLEHLDRGLIPNRFPDAGGAKPEYNTADATLWLFQAGHRYLEATSDIAFLRHKLYPAGKDILFWHERGTQYGIGVDPRDHLLVAGGEGTQLTWMDARVGDRVVTPRHGKPVEINALYYNALRLMARWARDLGDAPAALAYDAQAASVAESFQRLFWNRERGCLYDVVSDGIADARVRPNQIFAVGLPYPLLTPAQQRQVVDTVESSLLTHVGLRTLARGEDGYTPYYHGSAEQRDGAYHQGTVWPWLLGPFVRAYLRAHGKTRGNVAYCRALFRGIELHLNEGCLGTVSEVFDAEAPFSPGGAPAQAWSVAELLSVLTAELADDEVVSGAGRPSKGEWADAR